MSMLFQNQPSAQVSENWVAAVPVEPAPVDEQADNEGPGEFIDVEECEPGVFRNRPYQDQAIVRIEEELYGKKATENEPGIDPHQSTLLVMATGGGKTVIFANIIKRRKPGKALIIAHRAELIYQAKATLEALTGEPVSVEMADSYAKFDHNIIVATVQTLNAGMGGEGRMIAFRPEDYSLIISDEAHHSTAVSWKRVYDYFHSNPNLKHLGVTATPDRADEKALGQVFESVAFTYEIADMIRDGWLVPIVAVPIKVEGLDYSTIRTTAGDLNGKDLAHVMEVEAPLHEMMQAVIEQVCKAPINSLKETIAREQEADFAAGMTEFIAKYPMRKTLIFAASVAHGERLAEIINRWIPERAVFVCGETPKEKRASIFKDYHDGRYMFLVNVGVASEGFDEPTIEVVVMARPTKSRALYSQMLGRSTRVLPGIVDGIEAVEARKAAIAASIKPVATVIDFVGNCGKHTLMTPVDILGGDYSPQEQKKAKELLEDNDGAPMTPEEALEEARRLLEEAQAKEAARRAKVRCGAPYIIGNKIDPFAMFKVSAYREREWEKGKRPTEKQKEWLVRQKLWKDDLTGSEARQLCQGMQERRQKGLCSYRQAALLAKNGLPTECTFAQARTWIDTLANNGWHWPAGMPRPGAQA